MKNKELITKSLFDAVYNCDISKDVDMLRYYNRINIYEFAFKCKVWALTKGYMMKIENHYSDSIVIQIRKTTSKSSYIEPWKKTFRSEVEAIIKACNWILENIK